MKKLLLISCLLTGCPLPKGPSKPPTPIPTATPTIGTPPTILLSSANRCAPSFPVRSCKDIKFDGKKGGPFLRISTPPNRPGIKYGHQGDVLSAESVKVCQKKKCYTLKFDGCHNPDHTAQGLRPRAHYYFETKEALRGPATVTLESGGESCVYKAKDIRGTE